MNEPSVTLLIAVMQATVDQLTLLQLVTTQVLRTRAPNCDDAELTKDMDRLMTGGRLRPER